MVADPTTGLTQVFRKTADGFAPVKVEVRSEASGRSWITSPGLHVGNVVVSEGAYALLAPPAQSGD